MLDAAEPPAVPIGKHCDRPYTCSFYDHCHSFLPSRPVTGLPRISEALLDSLIADGIFAIEDVPLDYPQLTRRAARASASSCGPASHASSAM